MHRRHYPQNAVNIERVYTPVSGTRRGGETLGYRWLPGGATKPHATTAATVLIAPFAKQLVRHNKTDVCVLMIYTWTAVCAIRKKRKPSTPAYVVFKWSKWVCHLVGLTKKETRAIKKLFISYLKVWCYCSVSYVMILNVFVDIKLEFL